VAGRNTVDRGRGDRPHFPTISRLLVAQVLLCHLHPFDAETGEEYWVSGVKKRGRDRHWAGSGRVSIEASAVAEYLAEVGASELDRSRFEVISDLPTPRHEAFVALENAAREETRRRGG
jgi:hypothetical protein